ncbi:hypothetical protein AMAG_01030 [Allomyces macrogynus ATCC 38327]|uniref:SET domain-containing protein n=1 Tax=Allomyces macrogynus (strain ATCC 38327) TaxID=578462 RepID=A0A0L0RYG7_ALLM3|nr:hypothetical protein AMAG_01030 [Allomyces macrogynus ATCC 38327]|eukprot:KNE55096.1 hypothetical protein AMAG_01030 [Allomyces macrogynus ATCC 38327]
MSTSPSSSPRAKRSSSDRGRSPSRQHPAQASRSNGALPSYLSTGLTIALLALLLHQALVVQDGPLARFLGIPSPTRTLTNDHAVAELLAVQGQLVSATNDLHEQVAQLASQIHDLTKAQSRPPVSREDLMKPPHRFTMEHFLSHFGVEPIHHLAIDPAIQRFIAVHDVTTDKSFVDSPDEMTKRVRKYGAWIERGTSLDQRFYVAYTDDVRGFGLFAASPIRKGDVLGVYAGVLTNQSHTTDYEWSYPSDIRDEAGNTMNLGIDAKDRGNWFRFANDGDEDHINAEVQYVPYRNVWNIMYVANKAIPVDGEVLVSYGHGYWSSRPKLDMDGKLINPPPAVVEGDDASALPEAFHEIAGPAGSAVSEQTAV